MEDGALKLAHPANHTWREKSENANIYVRNHLSSKDRADLAEYRHESEILKKSKYRQDEPGSRRYFLRSKQPLIEKRQRMHYVAGN